MIVSPDWKADLRRIMAEHRLEARLLEVTVVCQCPLYSAEPHHMERNTVRKKPLLVAMLAMQADAALQQRRSRMHEVQMRFRSNDFNDCMSMSAERSPRQRINRFDENVLGNDQRLRDGD